ncbi:hypothetical protein PM3016_1770 [Paenibacillus mucilaginosus 3016]|uniref:Uncharacterized protein n=1 Tax=Paenibacillus mucilaginosus 3016 TaxID=1116391 RepID=H6NEZ1_9BACL|nr:hypothetical protein PM3016_1770 [Paenibacillus mucilaginosus 3016]
MSELGRYTKKISTRDGRTYAISLMPGRESLLLFRLFFCKQEP